MDELDIRYARSGGVAIAYLVIGEGDSDLVYVPDYMSNLVYNWMWRYWREFYERLAQSFRLILFDKRGTGLSDHGGQFAALETRMDDLRAVLDDLGSTDAVVFGAHEGSAMAALYAATYPERVRGPRALPPRPRLRAGPFGGATGARRPSRPVGHPRLQRRVVASGLPDAVRAGGGARVVRERATRRCEPSSRVRPEPRLPRDGSERGFARRQSTDARAVPGRFHG